MKILRQSQSSIRKSVLNHRAFSLSAHQQQIILHPILSSSPKQYAVTLDDRFMPEGIFTSWMTARIALLAMAMLVLAVAQFSWKTSSFELSHDQENRESHNRKVSFKWWSYVCKFIGRSWINLQQLFGETSESNEMETQATADHHSVSNKKHSKGNSAWKICTLERKEILNDRFIFCKFKTSDANLLEFGRKVILCTVDDSGRPIKEEFFPSLFPLDDKHFGVVSRIAKLSKVDNTSQLICTIANGDELAFRPGQNGVDNKSKQNPIRSLTIIAAGSGIIPILNLLKKTLGNSDFNIERCELLWINDSKEDFIFNNEVEKLEMGFGDRFLCARVLDVAIGAKDSILNQKVRESLPLAEEGRVAIVAAPSIVTKKFKPALDSLAYSAEDIITIHA
jgi:NAD(P)H-flavin reductase